MHEGNIHGCVGVELLEQLELAGVEVPLVEVGEGVPGDAELVPALVGEDQIVPVVDVELQHPLGIPGGQRTVSVLSHASIPAQFISLHNLLKKLS